MCAWLMEEKAALATQLQDAAERDDTAGALLLIANRAESGAGVAALNEEFYAGAGAGAVAGAGDGSSDSDGVVDLTGSRRKKDRGRGRKRLKKGGSSKKAKSATKAGAKLKCKFSGALGMGCSRPDCPACRRDDDGGDEDEEDDDDAEDEGEIGQALGRMARFKQAQERPGRRMSYGNQFADR